MSASKMKKRIKELEEKRDIGKLTPNEHVELMGLYDDLCDFLDNTLPQARIR